MRERAREREGNRGGERKGGEGEGEKKRERRAEREGGGVYATSKLKRQQETINVLPRLASSCLMDASGWFWV